MQPSGFLPLSRTDIQFWNSRQSLEGLSVRSVFFGVFQSFVVLLYILDNETNFVVQVSVFIGVLIDLWKITKVMDVRVWPAPCCSRGHGGWEGVVWPSQTLELALGVSQRLPHSQDKGIFTPGDFSGHTRAGELGAVGKGRGWNWLGGAGASTAADHGFPPRPQLDREHKVAGLFPRPTFKDKSTYVESSTKVYDDVSVPHPGPRDRLQAPAHSWGTRGWQWVGDQRICLLPVGPTLYGLCHTL